METIEFTIPEFIHLCSNLANCGIFLIIGTILLCFTPKQNEKRRGYVYTKRCFAISAYLMVVLNAANIALIINDIDHKILNTYFIPCIYFLQLYMTASALLSMIHADEKAHTVKYISSLPVLAIMIIYPISYLIWDDSDVYLGAYARFTHTTTAKTLSYGMIALILVNLALSTWLVARETRKYYRSVFRHPEGDNIEKARLVSRLVVFVQAYFIITSIGIITEGITTNLVNYDANIWLVWFNTAIFAAVAIGILNIYPIAVNAHISFLEKEALEDKEAKQIERIEEMLRKADANKEPKYEKQDPSQAEKQKKTDYEEFVKSATIEHAINKWCRKPSKPYCREGMTIAKAAEEMNIGERLLSNYINVVCKKNFNTWLNTLRIEEAKRIIQTMPRIQLVDVAARTGFTDTSALTKVFKKIEGQTPTEYKRAIKRNGEKPENEQ